MKREIVKEAFGAWVFMLAVVAFVIYLSEVLPRTMDGLQYSLAVGDALGLRLVKLGIFDLHGVGLLYFWGGRSFKISHSFKEYPVATSIILCAVLLGSALVLL